MAGRLVVPMAVLIILSVSGAAAAAMNPFDRCWRRDPKWASDRQRLAVCSAGFAGKMTQNAGRGLRQYVVTDPSDDPERPRPGTLRYGATVLRGKVWITFRRSMNIKLRQPLLISNNTAIDGRGVNVEISRGSGLLLYGARHIIIHGLKIHDVKGNPAGQVVSPTRQMTWMSGGDGDAIRVLSSQNVWIDHNELYRCEDGLVDVTLGSTKVTVSNNWFHNHDKVMLLGHDDDYVDDRRMRVTVAFNRFGPRCNQRMPRVRHGYAHVVNNLYQGWGLYAIGGSKGEKVKSEGNLFIASGQKQPVTRWIPGADGVAKAGSYRSKNDLFFNGAFFKPDGHGDGKAVLSPGYGRLERFPVGSPKTVRDLTKSAGRILCSTSRRC